MNELTFGVASSLESSSRNEQIAQELTLAYKERVAKEVMTKTGCSQQMFEDVWSETGRKSDLPMALRVIRRNDIYRTKVLESLKKELSEEDYINKSFTTTMFEEKDIEDCKRIGVTPEQMIEFLKSLY